MVTTEPVAPYNSPGVPDLPFFNTGESQNASPMVSATVFGLVAVIFFGLLRMTGLVIFYESIVKKKWAVNSAFMALYAYAAVLICWVTWAYKMSFGDELLPFWGKAGPAFAQKILIKNAIVPETEHGYKDGSLETATFVFLQFVFAGVTVVILTGALLGRMNFKAWMAFVPLWLTFSYTVGAFSLWGGGFLFQWGVIDFAGGYFTHLSSGTAGFTAACWVGPRLQEDREKIPPNNVPLMLTGAGFLWLGWCGLIGGAPYAVISFSFMAVLNTNICAATSLLVWTCLDVIFSKKATVTGALQGMIAGLVCITPAAGIVQGWAAIVMGVLSGSIPWFTMMIVHEKSAMLKKVDDTLAVVHTHAVAGLLGGALTGLFADPTLCSLFLGAMNSKGAFYGDGMQFVKQIVAAAFVIAWNIVVTSIVMVVIDHFIPLKMPELQLQIGDAEVHGEELYAL
ncbi:hypothetical protein SUGI_0586720 [Cryptomeria japonica]|uniref:ammonium transporter 3 member 1 n=1 Tax=Cryptomeria japonica TaxID=3369 RepID=UPI0024149038|nr:ammonium transporter 3 member 1 [Cryptomeria japonica]GLJ29732.1 hypothetical protein SUGI_0586720 [Cryptomeria japonica]